MINLVDPSAPKDTDDEDTGEVGVVAEESLFLEVSTW